MDTRHCNNCSCSLLSVISRSDSPFVQCASTKRSLYNSFVHKSSDPKVLRKFADRCCSGSPDNHYVCTPRLLSSSYCPAATGWRTTHLWWPSLRNVLTDPMMHNITFSPGNRTPYTWSISPSVSQLGVTLRPHTDHLTSIAYYSGLRQ